MIPPTQHRFVRIGPRSSSGGKTLHEVLLVLDGRHRARRQHPVLDGKDFRGHGECREKWVIVLRDEPGNNDVVGESLADLVGLGSNDPDGFIEGSDPENSAIDDGDGLEAAYSWKLEDEIGTISPGKRANLTILKSNPLSVDSSEIRNIGVWGTVMKGRKLAVGKTEKRASIEIPKGEEARNAFTHAALDHALKVVHAHY